MQTLRGSRRPGELIRPHGISRVNESCSERERSDLSNKDTLLTAMREPFHDNGFSWNPVHVPCVEADQTADGDPMV